MAADSGGCGGRRLLLSGTTGSPQSIIFFNPFCRRLFPPLLIKRSFTNLRLHHLLFIVLLLASGYLLFKNLGDAALWSDEAETAIIGRNFLKTGHFTAWDGRNLACNRNGSFLDANLDDRNPPLQFMVTAFSFAAFGENNFAARFPFALIGFLTIVLLYGTLRVEFPRRPAVALYAAAFLGLSTEYLLYARNCRYYSIAAFFALLTFFAYRRFVRGPNVKNSLGLAASAICLYYSHPLVAVAFLIPLAVFHVFFELNRVAKKQWINLLQVCMVFALATAPYTLLHHSWSRPDMPHGVSLHEHFFILLRYLRDSLTTGIAPWAIVAASTALLATRSLDAEPHRGMKLWLCILAGYIVLIGITTLQDLSKSQLYSRAADIRYLVAAFPFTAMLAGGLLERIGRKSKILGPSLALLALGTNITYALPRPDHHHQFPHAPVYSPLYDYCREIHCHYNTATAAVAGFLMEHAERNGTFLAYPDYRNDPLKFYTGFRLICSAILDSTSNLGATRVRSLSPFLLKNESFPDWIIFFGKYGYGPEIMRYFSRTTTGNNGVPAHCDYELAKELAVFPDESNRPEIFSHHFGEVVEVSPRDHVIIFHKVTGNDAAWLRHFSGIIGSAKDLHDQGAEERALKKLYDLYRHDSALVNKTFPRTVLYAVLKGYRLKLIAGNRPQEAEQLGKTLSSLAASLPPGSH